MTVQLQRNDGDAFVRCYLCGADAAGPCARCRRSVCGNCCVLVEGATHKWAVCTRCESKDGQHLKGWSGLLIFFIKIVAALIIAIFVLALLQK